MSLLCLKTFIIRHILQDIECQDTYNGFSRCFVRVSNMAAYFEESHTLQVFEYKERRIKQGIQEVS
jgi:hypothetical protein